MVSSALADRFGVPNVLSLHEMDDALYADLIAVDSNEPENFIVNMATALDHIRRKGACFYQVGFAVLVDDAPAAALTLSLSTLNVTLDYLAVAPAQQRRGVGRRIIAALVDVVPAGGWALHTNVRWNNYRMLDLVYRNGFRMVDGNLVINLTWMSDG